jgi:hypothetical protein
MLASFPVGSTSATGTTLFSSTRLKKVELWHVNNSVAANASMYWTFDEEDHVPLESKNDVPLTSQPGHIVMTPPSNSSVGFWQDYSASGTAFSLYVADSVGVLDITLEVRMVDQNHSVSSVTATAAGSGVRQWSPNVSEYIAVGYDTFTI